LIDEEYAIDQEAYSCKDEEHDSNVKITLFILDVFNVEVDKDGVG
jgi:hypothetical protein